MRYFSRQVKTIFFSTNWDVERPTMAVLRPSYSIITVGIIILLFLQTPHFFYFIALFLVGVTADAVNPFPLILSTIVPFMIFSILRSNMSIICLTAKLSVLFWFVSDKLREIFNLVFVKYVKTHTFHNYLCDHFYATGRTFHHLKVHILKHVPLDRSSTNDKVFWIHTFSATNPMILNEKIKTYGTISVFPYQSCPLFYLLAENLMAVENELINNLLFNFLLGPHFRP